MKIISIIFLLTIIMVSCNSNPDKQTATSKEVAVIANKTITLAVEGMTCTGCENTVKEALAALPGVDEVTASHTEGTALVKFDSTMTDMVAISAAITDAGYTVKGEK